MTQLHRIALTCCLMVLLSHRVSAAETKPSTTAAALQITHGPYLQAPSQSGITVVWVTNRNCMSKVEYGTKANALGETAVPSHHGLIDANTTLHCVSLTGLKPGTTYYYRAVSTEIVEFKPYKATYGQTVQSPLWQFTTLDERKRHFRFVVLNDRHEKVPPLMKALRSVGWDQVDLAFFNGDMISDPSTERQIYKGFLDPCCNIFAAAIPFIYARGNHETRGLLARRFSDYFPTDSGRYYYSISHGGVCFTMLDAGEDKADTSSEYSGLVDFEPYLKQETEWLRKEVQSEPFRKANFRVVLVHIPPTGMEDPKFIREKWVLQTWGPIFEKAKVDLVLSGHTHEYAETPPREGKNAFPMIIGGTETVIRVDVSEERMNVVVSNNDDSTRLSALRIAKKR
ncbi:MAG: FN3 domain-containing metallophosphoesterase family protein [Planctomycetota bacterium]|nr:FN3 domain-containing metallophosphoesterase family protein [Planctomycetota bacterium]